MRFHRTLDWWLAVLGCAIPLLYMPSGVMHMFLGKAVYGRDLLLATHFCLSLYCFIKTGHAPVLRRPLIILAVLSAFFGPLFLASASIKSGIIACKWMVLWADAMFTGYLLFLQRRFVKTALLAAVAAMGIITVDSAIGAYEYKRNSFLFAIDKEEETDAGSRVARSQQMAGQIRVQGLQRDVFTYANFQGIGCIVCIYLFATRRSWWVRLAAVPLGSAYLLMIFLSGGRSSLFGVLLATILGGLAMLSLRFFQKWARPILSGAVVLGLALCILGLGPILEEAVALLGSDSRAFNMQSTYERDAVWQERLDTMHDAPLSFLSGVPFTDWLHGDMPSVDFCDNQMLWFFYHTGVIGAVLMLFFLYQRARPETRAAHPKAHVALILFMGMVLGEGLVREGLLLFSALPTFLLFGYFLGADAFAAAAPQEELEAEPEPEATLEPALHA